MNDRKQKKWFLNTVLLTAGGLMLILVLMVVVDPYFHFHGPLKGISYRLYSERYINNGIAKHFEYDAVITGSSMNQNFKTSLLDELLGTNSIKIPFSGAGFKEVRQNLEVALNSENDVNYVLWGVDYNGLNRDFYWQGYSEYPEYLYDDILYNDVSYVYNKDILFEGLMNTFFRSLSGQETTSFDEYSTWDGGRGWDSISDTYRRSEAILPMEKISEEDIDRVTQNIQKNIINLANAYPDTEFILFYTPYSVLYWESLYRDGWLEKQLQIEQLATEMMLECENITLFDFCQETKITDDIMYYRDKEHYGKEINDMILHWISEGHGLVTEDNYKDNITWKYDHYMNFDYDSLYVGYEQYLIPWQD